MAAQVYGIRKTSRDTQETLKTQLEGQRHEVDRTLNERFATAADRLGDKPPAVRLAGAYAMAALADDWPENRQTCVDILCAYLRLPYDPDPGDNAEPAERAAYRANREVRHTIIRLIGDHLRPGAAVSWEGLDLDFAGVVFDGGVFASARFSGRWVRFDGAVFSGGSVYFSGAKFSGSKVSFDGAALLEEISADRLERMGVNARGLADADHLRPASPSAKPPTSCGPTARPSSTNCSSSAAAG